ncbi:hypothetical protein D3C87_1562040 [compost metagenome]
MPGRGVVRAVGLNHRLAGNGVDVAHFQVGTELAQFTKIQLHVFHHRAAFRQGGHGKRGPQPHAVNRNIAHRELKGLGLGIGLPTGLALAGTRDERGAKHLAPLDAGQAIRKGRHQRRAAVVEVNDFGALHAKADLHAAIGGGVEMESRAA